MKGERREGEIKKREDREEDSERGDEAGKNEKEEEGKVRGG